MTDIALFDFGGEDVRTGVAEDGRSYAVATDLAKAMGVSNTPDMVADVDPEDAGIVTIYSSGQRRRVNVLYKRGVFQVLMLSRKPKAIEFKNQLFDFLEEYERSGVVVHPDRSRFSDVDIEAEVQRQLQKRQYKEVVRDSLRAFGDQPGWQYGQLHNTILSAITGMSAPEILDSGREIQTYEADAPTSAERKVATNYLFADELEKFNLITDGVAVDLRYWKPTNYRAFLALVRDTSSRYA